MPRVLDLVGKQFEHFTVIKRVGKDKHGNIQWLCQCNCGNKFKSYSTPISKGKRKSCGCQSYSITRRRKRIKDPKEISFKRCINRTKQKAKCRGIKWELSYQQTRKLISSDCYYCGIQPSTDYNVYLTKTTGHCAVRHREYAEECWIKVNGIDRINSNGHYNPNNVVPCCRYCNQAKSTMSQQEFFNWIKRLYCHVQAMYN